MATLLYDGDKRVIYEVPENSSFITDVDGYRVYTPSDINNVEEEIIFTSTTLWSRFVDYHNLNKWSTNAFAKTGGAFRFTDANGVEIYQTFDIRLINDWRYVQANYPHKTKILGNVFPNTGELSIFDASRINVIGVVPEVQLADSLQTVVINSSNLGQSDIDAIANAVWNKEICP